ncbi:MAG: protein TolR [Proteobacteria bacterium]|nr:protein TolR [Pseudomonadota bacterium]
MAMHLNNRGGSNNGRRSRRVMHEINVTPFVDVMLVLLIVFMVTAPLLAVGIPVDLPDTRASDTLAEERPPLVITVQEDGVISVQKTAIDRTLLAARLQAISAENADIEVYVRGDRGVPYGEVISVMDLIKQAGLNRVKLVTKLANDG